MQTIKTAVVVVMLLAVLYGAYVALNGTDTPLPRELEQMAELDVNMDMLPPLQNGAGGSNAFQPAGTPNIPLASNPSLGNGFQSPSGATINNPNSLPQKDGPNASAGVVGLPNIQAPKDGTSPFAPPSSPFPAPNLVDTGKPFEPLTPGSPSATTAMPAAPTLFQSDANSNGDKDRKIPSYASTALPTDLPNVTESQGIQTPSAPTLLSGSSIDKNDPKSLTANIPAGAKDDKETKGEYKGLPNGATTKSYQNAKTLAMEQIARGELKEALMNLSIFYNAPELTYDQQTELLALLDPLAGEVIYSRRHLLDMPHIVVQGETLETIAKKYNVPAEILAKINAVNEQGAISPGTKLKVIPGPFRAEIELAKSELTLFLGELYAGRFAIEIGGDPTPKEGLFQVVEKQKNRNFYGKGGIAIPGNDPRNPYGGYWIDLGQDICIHGTPNQPVPNSKEMSCISLSPIDAADVFGMLERRSPVQIRR